MYGGFHKGGKKTGRLLENYVVCLYRPKGGEGVRTTGSKESDRLRSQVLKELAAIGLTRATDVLSVTDDKLQLKDPESMKPVHGAAIASVEKTSGGWKIKFYDKLKALELLGGYLGMSGAEGKTEEKNNLLEAILSSTQEALDTSDIQELQ